MFARRSLMRLLSRPEWICDECLRTAKLQPLITQQKRRISRNHIRKIQLAEEEWDLRKQDAEEGKRKSMLEVLEERGYVNQIVGNRNDLDKVLMEKRIGVYAGVDPTAPSLHIGHMVPFMALGWMFIHGYSATFLMGGFTAGVGDPIGRLTGREAQDKKTRVANAASMFQQLKRLGASMEAYATRRGYAKEWAWRRGVQNNNQWWGKVTLAQFLKVLGAGTRIGPMLGRDTVQNRLDSGEGMSFSEFTYPLIQAWDWWELYQSGVQMQIGGADQFGNILAGAEAVKYLLRNDADYKFRLQSQETAGQESQDPTLRDPVGFTVPLLTTSSGQKFGKSAGNAIWLDPGMTSSFDLYQFFLRSADTDVERYLKIFTFLSMSEIEAIMVEQRKDESQRHAQHKLASEFVELVHGPSAAKLAAQQHKQMFDKNLTLSDIQAQAKATRDVPVSKTDDGRPIDINPSLNKFAKPLDMHSGGDVNIILPESLVVQQPLGRILWSAGLVASRSEGQRMISNKGVYLGGQGGVTNKRPMGDLVSYTQITDPKWSSVSSFLLEENVLIIRTGKWRVKIITIVPDAEYEASGQSCPGWGEEEKSTSEQKIDNLDLYGEESLRRLDHTRILDKNNNKKAAQLAIARRSPAWKKV